jgi:hypothetical protein
VVALLLVKPTQFPDLFGEIKKAEQGKEKVSNKLGKFLFLPFW